MTKPKHEIVYERRIRSATNHWITVSILKFKRKLNVEISINNGIDDYAESIRLHQEEFLAIFDNDIGFNPVKIDFPKPKTFWNLNFGRSRTLRFVVDEDSMSFQIFYNGYRARCLESQFEDLEAIWKVVHPNVMNEFKKLLNKQRVDNF